MHVSSSFMFHVSERCQDAVHPTPLFELLGLMWLGRKIDPVNRWFTWPRTNMFPLMGYAMYVLWCIVYVYTYIITYKLRMHAITYTFIYCTCIYIITSTYTCTDTSPDTFYICVFCRHIQETNSTKSGQLGNSSNYLRKNAILQLDCWQSWRVVEKERKESCKMIEHIWALYVAISCCQGWRRCHWRVKMWHAWQSFRCPLLQRFATFTSGSQRINMALWMGDRMEDLGEGKVSRENSQDTAEDIRRWKDL